HCLLAAPAANRPGELVSDMGDRPQNVECDTRYRRIADRPAELTVPDLAAANDPEHEFAGEIGLAIARALEIVAALDRADHVFEPVAARHDCGIAHSNEWLIAEGEGPRIARRLDAEFERRRFIVQESLQDTILDNSDIAAGRAFVIDLDSNARLSVEAARGLVDQCNFLGCNLLAEPIAGDRAR